MEKIRVSQKVESEGSYRWNKAEGCGRGFSPVGAGVIAFISLWASQLWILAMVLLGVSMCAGVSGCLFTVGVHTDSSFGVGASFVCVWGGCLFPCPLWQNQGS